MLGWLLRLAYRAVLFAAAAVILYRHWKGMP